MDGAEDTLGKTSLGFSLIVVGLCESFGALLECLRGLAVWISRQRVGPDRWYFGEVGGLGRPDIRMEH